MGMTHKDENGKAGLYAKAIKRALDVAMALVALPFFALLCLFLVPLIRLSDGGPAFYVAKRLGRNGESFDMFKFRSMMVNAPDVRQADGSTYSAEDDPRLTRIGRVLRKTSLDELPQIINVLKGDMSIIGPRPDLPQQITYYKGDDFEKLKVRPGLTGYSQAYHRNAIPWEQRLALDVWYVRNLSFSLDVRVFFKTLATVVKGSNVYAQGGEAQEGVVPQETSHQEGRP